MVVEEGKPVGVITRHDLLDSCPTDLRSRESNPDPYPSGVVLRMVSTVLRPARPLRRSDYDRTTSGQLPPPPPGGYPPPPPPQGGAYPPPGGHGIPPDNNLVWGILVTLFCCLPLGIVSIVKASQVSGLWAQGRPAEAQAAADDRRSGRCGGRSPVPSSSCLSSSSTSSGHSPSMATWTPTTTDLTRTRTSRLGGLGAPLGVAALAVSACAVIWIGDPTTPGGPLPVSPPSSCWGSTVRAAAPCACSTRLMHGDVLAALRFNSLAVVAVAILLWAYAAWTYGRLVGPPCVHVAQPPTDGERDAGAGRGVVRRPQHSMVAVHRAARMSCGQRNALTPVSVSPITSWCTSEVPS